MPLQRNSFQHGRKNPMSPRVEPTLKRTVRAAIGDAPVKGHLAHKLRCARFIIHQRLIGTSRMEVQQPCRTAFLSLASVVLSPKPSLLLLLALVAGQAAAVESWTDNRLAITNDVLLWIDVSRQSAARGAAGLTPLQSWNDAPDVLLDGSGTSRHVYQPLLASRPKFRQEFNGAMLSFDGTNDFFSAMPGKATETNLTVFLVAAPRSNAGYFRGFFAFSAAGQNDYTTGLNFDLGGNASTGLSALNVEGGGCVGAAN